MLRVTWEWIAIYEPALDLANTVAVSDGVEHDLLERDGEFESWAEAPARSPALAADEAAALLHARTRLLALREHIRAVLRATAAGERLPRAPVAALNAATGAAPEWLELTADGELRRRTHGTAVERILAKYARSAMQIAAGGNAAVRVCGAPSCGMFYPPGRRQQRWCSVQCGTRARVARHYAAATRRPPGGRGSNPRSPERAHWRSRSRQP